MQRKLNYKNLKYKIKVFFLTVYIPRTLTVTAQKQQHLNSKVEHFLLPAILKKRRDFYYTI